MRIYDKYAKILPYKKTRKRRLDKNIKTEDQAVPQLPSKAQERSIFSTIDENFGFLNSIWGDGIDLAKVKYDIWEGKAQIGLAYIKGMIDTKLLSNQVVEPILQGKVDFITKAEILTLLQSKLISVPDIKTSKQMNQVVDGLLAGGTVIFVDGIDTALIIGTTNVDKRSIEKPDNEVTVLSAMDSFTEDLTTNVSLIIRRLPTPDLQFETFTAGRLSQTKIKLLWLEGMANKGIIEEAKRRIERIDIDNVDGIGVLAELIGDNSSSIFPTYRQTQRPDFTTKFLTEGRFAILCSNSPFALVAPISFWDNFKTMDDYSETPFVATYLRVVRMISFLLAVGVSPLYLSFVTYNHSIVPSALAVNIATGREGVPLPSVVELLIMTLSITIIREASLRASGSVGFFIGVLAAVVIGQATVQAGYVSASVIIVAAVSAITGFAISTTTLVLPARLINYFFILLASLFGMFGVINGMVIVLWYLLSLDSFGVPYFYPLIPFDLEGMKDTFIRSPYSYLKKRLRIYSPFNRIRMNKKGK